MLRIRLSRALLAALAVATLASGTTLITSGAADASPRIDPGIGRGPPRIDPGFGNGPTKVDPGFGKNNRPTFTVAKGRDYTLNSNCHWVPNPNPWWRYRNGAPSKVKACF
jgi:hypothetical protein